MYSAFSKVWWFHLPIEYERENQLYFYKWLIFHDSLSAINFLDIVHSNQPNEAIVQ